jgi:hypothetical protein
MLNADMQRPLKKSLPKCGARTRADGQCKAAPVRILNGWDQGWPRNGRCRLHGGRSTGPRTLEGKERCRAAALRNLERAHAARRTAASRSTRPPEEA